MTPSTDLITLDRAKAQIRTANPADDTLINQLITAASGWCEMYCRRKFKQGTYTELLQGGGQFLYVNNPPIQTARIRHTPYEAIFVRYQDGAGAQTQDASVTVSDDRLTLNTTYAGTTVNLDLMYSTYPLIIDLKNAINGVLGFNATGPSNLELWQSTELAFHTGTYFCRNWVANLYVYWLGVSDFKIGNEPTRDELFSWNGFLDVYQAYMVEYTGGFDPIPQDLQSAVAEVVQLMYAVRKSNPLMNSESIDRYSYTKQPEFNFQNLSMPSQHILNSYKLLNVSRYQ